MIFLLDLDVMNYCFCLILQPSFLPKRERLTVWLFLGWFRDKQIPQVFTQVLVSQESRDSRAAILEAAQVTTTFSSQKQHNRAPGGATS